MHLTNPEPEASDTLYQYPPTHVKTQNTFILASMNYFDSDISKSTNTVVYLVYGECHIHKHQLLGVVIGVPCCNAIFLTLSFILSQAEVISS
jgi:hypothetical protein